MSLWDLIGFGPRGWGVLLLIGAGMTLAVTFVALLIGAVFGSLIAWGKLSRSLTARVLGDAYTTVFRGVPELLVIYLCYFGGSTLVTRVAALFGQEGFLGLPSFLAGAIAVGLISGSYQAEVFRGAFLAVAPGEIEAARAMGMPALLRFRRIVAPQVLRFALPGLGNVWQLSIKDSALISVTGLAELLRTSQVAAGSTRQYLLFFAAGGVLYLAMTSLSNQVFDAAEARMSRSFGRRIGHA